ncbi:hypothetical protein CDAR_42831 [Caerostris darwini]|uniref:Uncharacterized protein n=1 Tax=Caerostris darwini TaxID=1538125 RepID=A0AAV4WH05_9ARAC|nr:hypothetical protein CDAR_42831 [Caerostris darwini]
MFTVMDPHFQALNLTRLSIINPVRRPRQTNPVFGHARLDIVSRSFVCPGSFLPRVIGPFVTLINPWTRSSASVGSGRDAFGTMTRISSGLERLAMC